MQLGADHVRVRVPATSANLGPGFDALGLALAIHDEVEVRLLASADVVVEVEGEGAGEVPTGAGHLVARAVRVGLDAVGAPITGLHLVCRNVIPHGRGLGSSAAAAVAGLVAARGLIADPSALDEATVLALATELEGHPDNAAPAILGGATVAWTPDARSGFSADDDGPAPARAVRLDVHPDLVATVVIPTTRLATSHARGVLPTHVPHADAAANSGRAALLVEALTRRPDLLFDATHDLLHQRYRADVMPGTWRLVDALRRQGLAAVVSGAGPSALVLTTPSAAADLDAVLESEVDLRRWRVERPSIAPTGATVERL
ncbi:homoserine kinase [Luteimicrobium xylanilyticum]|uniref:Homoserine kinase n=1 Tax=Luteimicrobium xylanilyticum TaxID=1133546 RepID=A0A5P9QC14_9MICO|nr:homoserine kinase [Luteimicrobium xylanilyticum]QFU98991.1 Homoserine kinase [Luteimicrobium xylanilyticum]